MAEYRYTEADRKSQLNALAVALSELIPRVRENTEFASKAKSYEDALAVARSLLSDGFNQDQLSQLGRAVPDLYFRHKEWTPPLEKSSDGAWKEPEWFVRLEEKLAPALAAAELLTTVGYY